MQVGIRWWEQAGINLSATRDATAASAERGGGRVTEGK